MSKLLQDVVGEITDRLDNWCEITIADGKKGWLECRTVETI